MAEIFGRASDLIPTTTSEVLYQCPVLEDVDVGSAENIVPAANVSPIQTKVTSINLCDVDSSPNNAHLVTLWHTDSTVTTPPVFGDANDSNILIHEYSVSAAGAASLNLGVHMISGDKLWMYANEGDEISINIYYIEVS